MARYNYYLAPWVWQVNPSGFSYWTQPVSVVGAIDFRPLAAQGRAGGTPQGYAFAASTQTISGVELTRNADLTKAVNNTLRDAWQGAMDYRPNGSTLLDLLWDQLTNGADPTGDPGPKPLMPGVDNVLRLYIGGHSLVKSERFHWGTHPHTNQVQAVIQRDFARMWEATNGADHCRRVLDFTCKKYKVDDWREFVPAHLLAHVPGRLPHQTTITESFNTADSDILGPNLTWTELVNDFDIVSNRAELITTGSDSFARADSDLSSDDHYAQALVNATNEAAAHSHYIMCRKDATTTLTLYMAYLQWNADVIRTYKDVSGSFTQLATQALSVTAGTPGTLKTQADGSTIKDFWDGVEKNSVTDTAITGNLRCGIAGFCATANILSWDDFEAADLAAEAGARMARRFGKSPLLEPALMPLQQD